ncbi:MAG: hypothetical protein IT247_04030 [Bacteroidia bacterium]|nr:hypothetical protein [Bacteroidia bacterium]
MKTYHPLLLLFTALLTMNVHCEKDEPRPPDQLPPYTQTGANTIGCLVNGRVFIPNKNDLYGYSFGYYQDELTFYIDRNSERVYIGIWDKTVTDTGIYDLTYVNAQKNIFYRWTDKTIVREFRTNNLHAGKLYIQYWDKQHHIMAGTFYFDAITGDSSIVHITEGRFDMIYN